MSNDEYKSKIVEKSWDPNIESKMFQNWETANIYKFKNDSENKQFVIDTPPPYPSGSPWHIGAAAHYSQIDMIARTARMMGYDVLFPIGIDRNGLPVEIYTEKKYNISMISTPREKFIDLCKTALDDLESQMISIMKTMGLSGNFDNYYRTDSDEYRQLTQDSFIDLWNKDLIYQSKRPNNYCIDCRTTIADAEITYSELPSSLVYLNFSLVDLDDSLTIATTRPELLSSCRAVLVNPDDERYLAYHHKRLKVPIYGNEVEVIPHPSAKPEFGSGIVMICSYGDYTDVLLFRELGLQETIVIDISGKMNELAKSYAGLDVTVARKKIIEDLHSNNYVVKEESINHRTPVCERSRTPIEIISMNEFYLKQIEYKEELLEDANKLIFHPEEHRRRLVDWIESISMDWPISRRRVNATEVPVWYCKSCEHPHIPEKGRYYRPWKDPSPFTSCVKCNSSEFYGDERTLDTWMDSSISPLYVSSFSKNDSDFKKHYPTSLRPQSKDIIRSWLYYTMLRCKQITNEIPFKHAWIMGYGVDEKGEKMSKSKGNVVDPMPILKKYGADMFRFWAASESNLGSDFRVSEPKIAGVGKFLTKLWNISRFISCFPVVEEPKLAETDKWILSELTSLQEDSLEGYNDFNFFVPSTKIRDFMWNLFAPHYIEMVKQRAYGINFSNDEKLSAWFTLHTCLKNSLLFLSPIIPFVTDKIWTELYSQNSIHVEKFPKLSYNYYEQSTSERITSLNSEIWNIKKSRQLSLRSPIDYTIPDDLSVFESDLKAMHKIQ